MSYILDALKRADAERDRGQVPGLHAHPRADALATTRAPGLPRWALIGAGAFGLVVVAALAWRLGADAHAPLPSPALGPAAESNAVESPAKTAAAPAPIPATPPRRGAVEDRPAPAVAPVATPTPPAAPTGAQETPKNAAPAPVTAPAQAAPIPLYAELPPSLRSQLPKLTVTGSVFSPDASARFIMLNGEVVKEGGQPAPGLVVERIEPKSAVLRYKGERFRLPY